MTGCVWRCWCCVGVLTMSCIELPCWSPGQCMYWSTDGCPKRRWRVPYPATAELMHHVVSTACTIISGKHRRNIKCWCALRCWWHWVHVLICGLSWCWCWGVDDIRLMVCWRVHVSITLCGYVLMTVLMCWSVEVLMCWCVVNVLMCWWDCVDVLMCWCVDVLTCLWLVGVCVDALMLMCWCVDVLMCWWDCVDDVVLMCCRWSRWCVDVFVLMRWWCVDHSVDVFMGWCVHLLLMLCYGLMIAFMYWWLRWCVDDCVDVLTCWWHCVDVLMFWSVWWMCCELMCWCVDVLMCWCVDVLMCWCVDVLMCWWHCVDDIVLMDMVWGITNIGCDPII